MMRLFGFIIIVFVILTSCKKENGNNDDDIIDTIIGTKPEVVILEIGLQNSNFAFVGREFPLRASIKAENEIKSILITLTPQDGQPWDFDTTMIDNYENNVEVIFEENFEISDEAELGHFHLHIWVTDKEDLINEEIWEDLFIHRF